MFKGPSRSLTIVSALVAAGLSACTNGPRPLAYDDAAYPPIGVKLSPRELAVSRPVRLSNGQVALRPVNDGIPWLFGFGDAYGKASGLPTRAGVTPSVLANTPSGGLVPGQEPY